jgi:hypothetical protein
VRPAVHQVAQQVQVSRLGENPMVSSSRCRALVAALHIADQVKCHGVDSFDSMDFLLIALLTLLNGAFAMSELALTASRKARLTAMAEAGDKGAQAALALLDNPTRFLSSVQVGITSIGMLNGIVGEAAFSDDVAAWAAWALGLPDGRPDHGHGHGGHRHHLHHHRVWRTGAQAHRPALSRDGVALVAGP